MASLSVMCSEFEKVGCTGSAELDLFQILCKTVLISAKCYQSWPNFTLFTNIFIFYKTLPNLPKLSKLTNLLPNFTKLYQNFTKNSFVPISNYCNWRLFSDKAVAPKSQAWQKYYFSNSSCVHVHIFALYQYIPPVMTSLQYLTR